MTQTAWFSREPERIEVKPEDRPELGEWCELSAIGTKRHTLDRGTNVIWKEIRQDQPVQAMYIGYRTVYNGWSEWEVWLFVTDVRHNPIHAFPCSVKRVNAITAETVKDYYADISVTEGGFGATIMKWNGSYWVVSASHTELEQKDMTFWLNRRFPGIRILWDV